MSGYAWASKAGKDILIKPAHPDELRARISAVLG
jgi:DNA-binding response OmpR family regulator